MNKGEYTEGPKALENFKRGMQALNAGKIGWLPHDYVGRGAKPFSTHWAPDALKNQCPGTLDG
jgi:hypothetical protein